MIGWSLDIEALVEECGEKKKIYIYIYTYIYIFLLLLLFLRLWAWWTYTKQISEGQKGISKVDNEWSQMQEENRENRRERFNQVSDAS